jgi:hypothetical protein
VGDSNTSSPVSPEVFSAVARSGRLRERRTAAGPRVVCDAGDHLVHRRVSSAGPVNPGRAVAGPWIIDSVISSVR